LIKRLSAANPEADVIVSNQLFADDVQKITMFEDADTVGISVSNFTRDDLHDMAEDFVDD
jgi:hypothetical protein